MVGSVSPRGPAVGPSRTAGWRGPGAAARPPGTGLGWHGWHGWHTAVTVVVVFELFTG